MTYGMMIGVRTASPFKRLEDLIAFAKANPGKLTFYSVGAGSAHHLIGEWVNALTGAELQHVPYKSRASSKRDGFRWNDIGTCVSARVQTRLIA